MDGWNGRQAAAGCKDIRTESVKRFTRVCIIIRKGVRPKDVTEQFKDR